MGQGGYPGIQISDGIRAMQITLRLQQVTFSNLYELVGHPMLENIAVCGSPEEWLDIRETILNHETASDSTYKRVRFVRKKQLWRISNPDAESKFLEVPDRVAKDFANRIEKMIDL